MLNFLKGVQPLLFGGEGAFAHKTRKLGGLALDRRRNKLAMSRAACGKAAIPVDGLSSELSNPTAIMTCSRQCSHILTTSFDTYPPPPPC